MLAPGAANATTGNAMRNTIAILIGLIATVAAHGATAETLKIAVAQRGFWNS